MTTAETSNKFSYIIANDEYEVLKLAYELADAAATSAIESMAYTVRINGEMWSDLASKGPGDEPLRVECANEIRYAEARKLLRHHPTRPYLVQIVEAK